MMIRGGLLLFSGAGAVAYELAAIRAFSSVFGGTVKSEAVIVSVFLAALALGALLFGRLADRIRRPVLLFGGLAVLGGLLMMVTPQLLERVDRLAAEAVFATGWRRYFSLALAAVGLVGAPALLLGGTLPALVSASRHTALLRRAPGLLYGINTLGSVLGALLAGFMLLESLGIRSTLRASGGLVLLSGAAGLLLGRRSLFDTGAPKEGAPLNRAVRGLLVSAFCAGCAVLALEVLGTRLLMQFMHSSAHSFALVLIVFLAGISAGAAFGARHAERHREAAAGLAFGLAALGMLIAATGPLMVWAGELSGQNVLRGLAGQFALASILFPATFASGAVFAIQAAHTQSSGRPGSHVGRVTFANTCGGIAGSLLAGFYCLPAFGIKLSLLLFAAVAILGAFTVADSRRTVAVATAGALPVLALLLPFELRPLPDHPFYRQLVSYREGPVANVVVMESPAEERPVLFINRTTLQGGGRQALFLERKQGLLPSALHPDPTSALVLGVGTGATISGLLDAGLRSVHAVELVDSVIDVLPLFSGGIGGISNLLLRPEVQFFREDAVAFVRAVRGSYDLIVGDLFFPWLDGAGALYSVEHFRAVKERLSTGGLFCQWVPLYQLKWEDFGLLARTFRFVFPQTWILLAEPAAARPVVALIGSVEPLTLDPDRLNRLFQGSRFAPAYQSVNLGAAGDLLELYFGDQYTIDAAFGGARALGEEHLLNTLDRPILEYRSARTRESEDVLALANLNNLALHLGGSPAIYLDPSGDQSDERRSRLERDIDRRAAALVQQLFGRYAMLRARLPGQDRLLLERKEAEHYLTGLWIAPDHEALNRSAAELSYRMLNDRRHAEVVAYVTRLLELQPDNERAKGNLALAYLALGQEREAAELLAPLLEREREIDVTNMMLLGIASYLQGEDAQAREALRRAFSAATTELPSLAIAIGLALEGEMDDALRMAAPLTGDRVWGILAKRALERFQQVAEAAPERGGG